MMSTIYQRIPAIMRALGAVPKAQQNEKQGYPYRGIDDVLNALHPLLAQYGVFPVPEVLECVQTERDTRNSRVLHTILTVRYTFYAEDGSSVATTVKGEGMDNGDKSMNKAMSAAFKYALIQIFAIPTAELLDSERDSYDINTQSVPSTSSAQPVSEQKKSASVPPPTRAESVKPMVAAASMPMSERKAAPVAAAVAPAVVAETSTEAIPAGQKIVESRVIEQRLARCEELLACVNVIGEDVDKWRQRFQTLKGMRANTEAFQSQIDSFGKTLKEFVTKELNSVSSYFEDIFHSKLAEKNRTAKEWQEIIDTVAAGINDKLLDLEAKDQLIRSKGATLHDIKIGIFRYSALAYTMKN